MTDSTLSSSNTSELALLRKVLEASPSFLHVLRGPDFIFEYANEAYYRLVGRRDLIGRPAFEAMPEAAGEYPQRIARVMATQKPFHGTEIPVMLARVAGAPPEVRWIDLVYLPLIEADGTCQRVLGHGTDVTDNVRMRREAEQAGQRSRDRLSDALVARRMIAWEWNVHTDIVTSSGAWLELFGSKDKIFNTGEAAIQHVHPDDRETRIATIKATLAGLAPWHLEYRAMRADGSVLWLEERASVSSDLATGQRIIVLAWLGKSRRECRRKMRWCWLTFAKTISLPPSPMNCAIPWHPFAAACRLSSC